MHNKYTMIKREESIDHQLRATWQMVSKMYNEEASKHESTMAMAFALLNIDFENGTASTSLGPKMGMEATSLSRLLNNLEEKKLIYREKNPNDGRSVLIKLTEFGVEKREVSKKSVLQFNEIVRKNVSKRDLDGFFKTMQIINKLITDKSIF